jgi:hypothetical protein
MIEDNNEDEFTRDDPLAMQSWPRESGVRGERGFQETARRVSSAAGDGWAQARQRASEARERTELFLRENPVPTILGALAVGIAIGLVIRYASSAVEEKDEAKTPLGNWDWSFFSLPFLWPLLRSARDKYQESAEALKGGAARLRKIDINRYAKPIRKRWKAFTD